VIYWRRWATLGVGKYGRWGSWTEDSKYDAVLPLRIDMVGFEVKRQRPLRPYPRKRKIMVREPQNWYKVGAFRDYTLFYNFFILQSYIRYIGKTSPPT